MIFLSLYAKIQNDKYIINQDLTLTHEEFKIKLKNLSLNLKEFCKIVDTSYSTVSKFGKSNPMPGWVEPFLNLLQENKNMENIKQEIKSLALKL